MTSSYVWKDRPKGFPSDDTAPQRTAREMNGFSDDNDDDSDENAIELRDTAANRSKFLRSRDSIFVSKQRAKARNSAPQIFSESEPQTNSNQNLNSNSDSESDSNRDSKDQNREPARPSVRFSIAMSPENGADNPAFVGDDSDTEKVVLRKSKSISYNPNLDPNFDMDHYLTFVDIPESANTTPRSSVGESRRWDAFVSLPEEDDDETLDSQWIEVFLKIFKLIAYVLTFIIVLFTSVLSKAITFLMTSMIQIDRTIPVCNQGIPSLKNVKDQKFVAKIEYDSEERVAWIWGLLFILIAPEIFTFFRSARLCTFKNIKRPEPSTFFFALAMETLQTIGIIMLFYLVLPVLDSNRGIMVTNSLFLLPAILLILSRKAGARKGLESVLDLFAIIVQLLALAMWPVIDYWKDELRSDDIGRHNKWALPVSCFLVSFGWWENFVSAKSANSWIRWMASFKSDLNACRYSIYLFVSLWKIALMFAGMILIQFLIAADGAGAVRSLFDQFVGAFHVHDITLVRDKGDLDSHVVFEEPHAMDSHPSALVWLIVIQIAATLLCYLTCKFVCKICIQSFSFALPVSLSIPATVSLLIAACGIRNHDLCQMTEFFHPFQYIFWNCHNQIFKADDQSFLNVNVLLWILCMLSQTWISVHIWSSSSERLAPTEKLFVTPFYSGVIVDQSVAFNRKRDHEDYSDKSDEEKLKLDDEDDYYADQEMAENMTYNFTELSLRNSIGSPEGSHRADTVVRIYACATMWHENREEMIQMLKSIMRMDEDQCARKQAQQWLHVTAKQAEYYEIESHIFFDDAFEQGLTDEEDDRVVNKFVLQLVDVIDEAASNVHQCNIKIKSPKRMATPYGGRLEWTLPGQNKLIAHIKDKIKIRHRKRWSQVMYMYYLLGLRIAALPIDEYRKRIIADNTFVLALDGDINFRPNAVHLLVDLMKKNKTLGAACGRIHPVGSGPMVWYQKFEYAISHWLQKATEHIFGCVLCSPGCFSLFRARALMDENVMHRYTTKPTEALHYVQYDQGEDRWLCTLMLQQGWRVEYSAASDAYTHCPEAFDEFYIQRRRWAPSTMANIMDLLRDYKHTVRNNENISTLYIIYQGGLMLGTILSPGTIFLMLVGAMNTAFGFQGITSFYINVIPVLVFVLICFFSKNDMQILAAQMLSTLYAMLMLAVLVSTGIEISEEGLLSPSAFFFVGICATFIIAAIIHPQEFFCVLPAVLYLLTIPSMYLLLTIYSIINLNVVSWGTREVKSKLTAKEKQEQELIELEAKNKKKSGFLSWLPLGNNKNRSSSPSSWGFTCMCCSQPKNDEEKVHLMDIKETLNSFNQNIAALKVTVDGIKQPSALRRGSGAPKRSTRFADNVVISSIGELDEPFDDEEEEEQSEETAPMVDEKDPIKDSAKPFNKIEPDWIKDKGLKGGPIVAISAPEEAFWKEFIGKYLEPLDEDRKHQEKIAADLIELRNKAVFAFGMINALFVLFVFLLQMHKDVFHINWPIGVDHMNRTYNEDQDKWEETPIYKYVQMDPIGLVLVAFFGAILVIQVIGMFLHRFGTIAHLLAFAEIDWCTTKEEDLSDDKIIDNNAVQIAKMLQKLKGIDNVGRKRSSAHEVGAFGYQKEQNYRLDVAFRKRLMSLRPEEPNMENVSPGLHGLRRKSTVNALVGRRNTILETRRKSIAPFLSFSSFEETPQPSESAFFTPPSPDQKPSDPVIEPVVQTSDANNNTTADKPVERVIMRADSEPTGQHVMASYNMANNNLQGMSEGMSADIIRNSLIELTNAADRDRNESPANGGSDSSRSNVHQIEAVVHTSNESESASDSTASSVSSNIDFNFDSIEDDISNDFPIDTFHPTRVSQRDSQADIHWNIPIGHTTEADGKMSTHL